MMKGQRIQEVKKNRSPEFNENEKACIQYNDNRSERGDYSFKCLY